MGIAQRIHDTIEDWRIEWGDKLKAWVTSGLTKGAEEFMDFLEPDLRAEVTPSLLRLKEIEGLPDDFKAILDKAIEEPKAIQLAAILPYLVGMLIGFGMGAAAPVAKVGSYTVDKMIHSARLNPLEVITAWRRDKPTYEKLFDDLRDQGWNEDRIEALKFYTLFYPTPSDLIHWQAREVFEPSMISKYGLDSEFGEIDQAIFDKAGMLPEQTLNYWRAHWVHPDWRQVATMYHRGEITFDDIERWYRVVEIPPYWRDKLTGITWDLPNRIETRMMARYGLVDKPWLVEHLKKVGLHEDYRGIAADFMLAMGIRMDISSRYSKGWLTSEDVKSEIATFGLSDDIADRLYQWIVKNVSGDRVTTEKNLTKADILKGIKKGVVTVDEGKELLSDLGYEADEVDYIVDANITISEEIPEVVKERDLTKTDILNAIKKEVVTIETGRSMLFGLGYDQTEVDILVLNKLGASSLEPTALLATGASPNSYMGFKQLTQRYRKSQGLESKVIPVEVTEANRALVIAKGALAEAKERGAKEAKLDPYLKAVSNAEYRYRQLYIKWQEAIKAMPA